MPGNGFDDRVHNFFAQDSSSQEHQSHVRNWHVLNSNSWFGNQRQIDVLNASSKSYTSQDSEIDGGQSSYPVHEAQGLNFSQSNLRPDFPKSQSQTEQQYPNGFMHGNQFYQTRQKEANFTTVDTDSDQRHLIASRGLSVHELQQRSGHEQQAKSSDRLVTSGHPVSFDLFGGQQHTSHQQASMLQAFQRQQSGLNDMQELQQQLMIRKMQELQRNGQLRQLDVMPQNLINQVPTFTKQATGSQSSTLVNGTPNSLQTPLTAEPGTNWYSRGSAALQGSNGLVFPPNRGQMGMVSQQADQSLYGVPVSTSRGLVLNQHAQMVIDRSSVPQMETSSNSLHSNQHNVLPDQIGRQERTSISRQKLQNDNFGHASRQSLNIGLKDTDSFQQVKSMQRNASQKELLRRHDLASPAEALHERSAGRVTSSQDEVVLDPAEEKILYGSDDNIWSAFGKSSDISGEAGKLFDNDTSSNGFQSIQSGSWSALMQSAVAETTSSDVGGQDEWSGLNFHNTDDSSANQPASMHNDNVKQTSFTNKNMRTAPALGSGSISTFSDINTSNIMELNRFGHKFQNESVQRQLSDSSQRFGESLEEPSKWSNHIPMQKSVAEGSQVYGNASQGSLGAERNTKTISGSWALGQSGRREQPNGWNPLGAVSPGEDRLFAANETEKLVQNSQNNRLRVMQGEALNGSSLWKSDSVTGLATEFGTVQSTVGKFQENRAGLSFNGSAASVANTFNMGVGDGSGSSVQKNHLFNQWKNVNSSMGAEALCSLTTVEVAKHDSENSGDSHRSNTSQHASGGLRERLSDASDPKSLPWGKQKLTNQVASRVSVPRKFQFHPMENLDEDVEPTNGLMQLIQGEKDNKSLEQGPSAPFSRPFDSYTNKAPSPSQNMLELLHKVDQSGDHGAMMHLSSSERNVSSKLPGAENFLGSAGHLQHSQSSVAQGFGLQLGPPSQRLQIPELSSPSQTAQGIVNSMDASCTGAEMGEKDLPRISTSPIQSLPFASEESQIEVEKDNSAGPDDSRNEKSLRKVPGNYHPAFGSDTPFKISQLQNKQTKISGKVTRNQHVDSSFSSNTSYPMQSGETVRHDDSHNIRKDNLAYDVQERGPAASTSTRDQTRSSPHFGMPGISQQGASNQVLYNMWNNVPNSQHTLAALYPKSPSHFSALPPKIVESNPPGDQDFSKGDRLQSKLSYSNFPGVDGEEHRVKESSEQLGSFMNTDSAPKTEKSLGKTSPLKNQMDDSPVSSASTQDIEAFGRSLKPNIFSNKKYALLNQMRALKDGEPDPINRASKRIKGPTGQLNEDSVGNSLCAGTPADDSGMPNFSTPSYILQRNISPHGNIASQEVAAAAQDLSQSNPSNDCTTSARTEHHQVSPQMAPSQFNQYVYFRNGQVLPMYNAQKVTSRSEELPFDLGPSNDLNASNLEDKSTVLIDACRVNSTVLNPVPISEANENLSDPLSPLLNVTGQYPVTLGPKKRKTATSELDPWHKDIADVSQNLSILSVADAEWNKAANRLTEKVGNDVQFFEDGPPVVRLKRRLILTTQLMQQLFRPPPSTILSADASFRYEGVTYAVSRVALGDACRAVSHSTVLGLPPDGVDLHSARGKVNGDSCSAKVIEELLGKARKLENDFLRLGKSASILDMRLECQDVEKFSVINRFAKFNGRGQTDNADASSTGATVTTQKPCVQSYVTALPLPRSLPDRVQCLSL